jgi:hypothetical protein
MFNTCEDAAYEYLDRGFSVIPIGNSKKPLVKWERYQTQHATMDEVAEWFQKWPNANIGIVTGAISGLVAVDADGPKGETWIEAHLPPTAVYQKTGKGKHAIYAHPGYEVRNRGRLAPEVDIRGDGGYIVVEPSVHETGVVYEWVYIEGFNGFDDLTQYEPPQAQVSESYPKLGQGNLNKDLSNVSPWISEDDPCPMGRRNNTLAQLVGHWLNENPDYFAALDRAKQWNVARCNPQLGESELTTTVRSIYRRHVTNSPTPPQAEPVEVVDQSQIYVPSANVRTIPQAILNPGGLLQELTQYIEDSSAASFPLFNMGAAICLLGTMVGQKIMTETKLRTNFYVFSLAASGTGKDAPLGAFSQLVNHWKGGSNNLGPNHVTSGAAIIKLLMSHTPMVMMMDEIGDLMAGLKNSNTPQADIPRILKEAFSATNRGIKKTSAINDTEEVKWHHLSLYGTAAPGRFWKSLTFGDVTDGFLARVLILESDHDAPEPVKPKVDIPPVGLVQRLQAVQDIQRNHLDGNLSPPVPQMIAKTPDAEAMLTQWAKQYFKLRNQTKDAEDGRPAIYGRAAEHAHKLALVHAVSRLGANIVQGQVIAEDVEWAMALVDWVVPGMVEQIAENITVNEFDEWAQKVKTAICNVATAERPGASKRDIRQRVRGLNPRLFDEVMKSLEDSGEVGQFEWKPPRGFKITLWGFRREKS